MIVERDRVECGNLERVKFAPSGWNFGTLFRQPAAAAARPDSLVFPFFVVVVVAVLTLTLQLIIDEKRARIADFRVFPHTYRRGPRLSLKIKSWLFESAWGFKVFLALVVHIVYVVVVVMYVSFLGQYDGWMVELLGRLLSTIAVDSRYFI